jgi:hypothetical protein
MKNKTNRLLKFWLAALLIGVSGLFFGVRSAYAYYQQDGNPASYSEDLCYVSPGQTVVEWKSTYQAPCRHSIWGICIWPLPHKHVTYKVTVDDGIPLLSRRGTVIAAIDGEEKRSWLTYDQTSWNALEDNPSGKISYLDFEPIASNEYVVMVETRYRLFSNVDTTLGICIQQP